MAVPDFPHIFATYFYRGEFAELLFCHIVNVVDKGLRVVTMEDKFEADRQKASKYTMLEWTDVIFIISNEKRE